MNNFTLSDFNLVLRNDFHTFMKKSFDSQHPGIELADNWHLKAITHHLDLCMRGEIKRLVITLPPRSLKTHITSVSFPAFLLGQDPSTKIVCASYSGQLSEVFSNQSRLLMMESWYKELFPRTVISPIKNTAAEFDTTMHGHRIATSPGGTLTGRGGDIIIIDDINKASDYKSPVSREKANLWFDTTLQSRLNSIKDGCIIIVQQRIHTDDLAGHVLKKGGWTHLNLPAIAQENQEIAISDEATYLFKKDDLLHKARLDRETLEQQRKNVGGYIFSAQYLQAPVPEEGNLIPVGSFKTFNNPPTPQQGDLIVHSWDIASGQGDHNDYSVGTIWRYRYNQFYLLDVVRRKFTYSDLLAEIHHQAIESSANLVLIEKAGVGEALIDELRQYSNLNIYPVVPLKDKVTRMMPGTADIEAGKVALPAEALWRAEFEKECAEFPNGKHDDQVDSLSQFLNWARAYRGQGKEAKKLVTALHELAQTSSPNELQTKEDLKRFLWPNI
ncbi:MAG: phage terminase large subunit [Cycloclasticus sp.]|nr:phage terminase large subunit [Cycloclasticus sp.]